MCYLARETIVVVDLNVSCARFSGMKYGRYPDDLAVRLGRHRVVAVR